MQTGPTPTLKTLDEEVKEEVGLNVELIDTRVSIRRKDEEYKELICPVGLNRHRISKTHEHVTFIYFARSKSDKVVPEKETDVWKWCSKDDIGKLDPIPEDVVYYSKRAVSEVK